jgi:hypothetical protein
MVPSFAPVEQNLVDFTSIKRKGNVIIKPLRSKKSTDGKELNNNILSFRGWRDPNTDVWYGIPIGRNADGTFKFKRIIIDGHRHYNLEIEQDAKEWHVVQFHPAICNDGIRTRFHMFEVIDTERDAQSKIDKVTKSMDALALINSVDMTESKIRDIARLFAIDTMNNSYIVIKQLLYEKAMNKPEYFMSLLENEEERDIRVIIQRGMATGLIQLTPDKGYLFKNSIPLGSTEGSIINSLRKDRAMLINIDMESKEKDIFYKAEETLKAKPTLDAKIETTKKGNQSPLKRKNLSAQFEKE